MEQGELARPVCRGGAEGESPTDRSFVRVARCPPPPQAFLRLTPLQYMFEYARDVWCLAVMDSRDNGGVAAVGAIALRNTMIKFDLQVPA